MVNKQEIEVAKMLGNIYSELFQRRALTDSVLKISNSPNDVCPVVESSRAFLITETNDHVWGPGGQSPETDGVGMAGRWSEAVWG